MLRIDNAAAAISQLSCFRALASLKRPIPSKIIIVPTIAKKILNPKVATVSNLSCPYGWSSSGASPERFAAYHVTQSVRRSEKE